jgi:hypothetical protein
MPWVLSVLHSLCSHTTILSSPPYLGWNPSPLSTTASFHIHTILGEDSHLPTRSYLLKCIVTHRNAGWLLHLIKTPFGNLLTSSCKFSLSSWEHLPIETETPWEQDEYFFTSVLCTNVFHSSANPIAVLNLSFSTYWHVCFQFPEIS